MLHSLQFITSFLIGQCSKAASCVAPHHEQRKHCPGCDGLIYFVCGPVLGCDDGPFEEDSVVCPRDDSLVLQQPGATS